MSIENNNVCYVTGKPITDNDEFIVLGNGHRALMECVENGDVLQCDDCGEFFVADDMVSINNRSYYVCSDCLDEGNYYCCEDCGEYFTDTHCHYVHNVGYVCDDCIDSGDYTRCDDCGEYYCSDDVWYCERDDAYYCPDCECYHDSDELIADYHCHSNCLEFFGDDKENSKPYFGVELEIDKGDDNDTVAQHAVDNFPDNFIYFEYDGSLDSGFENITQPATLDYHMSLKNTYDDYFKYAVDCGYRSHNTRTCGLHVHFNRNFFKDNEELYVTRLLYIVEKFWDELVKFSRRNIDNLNRWAKKYDKTPEEVVNDWKTDSWKLDRYQAVNLTNRNTIEFRMFRGTLKYNTFISTIQLCYAMVTTAKSIESIEAIQNMHFEDLLMFDEVKAYWEEVKHRGE